MDAVMGPDIPISHPTMGSGATAWAGATGFTSSEEMALTCSLKVEGRRSAPELRPLLLPGLTLSIFLAENLSVMDLTLCGTRMLTRQMRRLLVCSSLNQHPSPAAQMELGPTRP